MFIVKDIIADSYDEKTRRQKALAVNAIAAGQILKEKYVTGDQASAEEVRLEKQLENATNFAEENAKKRANKDRKDIEVIE